MFTGLVEALGTVQTLESKGNQARLTLEMPFAKELAIGDSVAINGCCLTVSKFSPERASFDLLEQTLKVTSLGALKPKSLVNLERAMQAGARFGGHFMQGHVDGVGTLTRLEVRGQDHVIHVSLPPEIHRLCIDKGSLTLDGISLTIAELTPDGAMFWITPHTWENTHLHAAKIDQLMNLETDMLAKYVDKLLAMRIQHANIGTI